MSLITNIAAYCFATLSDLKPLRLKLQQFCKENQLKGTILLSTEGINLFVAGQKEKIAALLYELRSIPGLEQLTPKYSESEHQPFSRMLVRIKKEIIAFGVAGINPAVRTSPKLPPSELKAWLDAGKPITLLDTRNTYEVKLGTFKNALTFDLDHFRNFPAVVATLPEAMKKQPIVMFCTGGIRCEKAGPYMEQVGFENIYQLEGGILKYFEDCGSEHYDGECFVFDQRVGVDPSLAESDNSLCFACQSPLTPEEQQDSRFVPGESCPYCYLTSHEQMARTIAKRHATITQLTQKLPGSAPYDNYRPIHISAPHHGLTMIDVLSSIFKHIPREEWLTVLQQNRIVNNDRRPIAPEHIVQAGEVYLHWLPGTQEPDVNANIKILYEDESLIAILKPAPLPVHACGRYNRNTLQFILNEVYAPQKLRPAHRLDANTTGILVLARTKHFASQLQPQFANGTVIKHYLARVQGHPPQNEFECTAPIGQTAQELGTRGVEEQGLPAHTKFKVLHRFADNTTLLEAQPLTGRTNQIRVHLWQLGFSIVGDQAYKEQQQIGDTQTHSLHDSPLCLHAWKLQLRHPLSQEQIEFIAEIPDWATLPDSTTIETH